MKTINLSNAQIRTASSYATGHQVYERMVVALEIAKCQRLDLIAQHCLAMQIYDSVKNYRSEIYSLHSSILHAYREICNTVIWGDRPAAMRAVVDSHYDQISAICNRYRKSTIAKWFPVAVALIAPNDIGAMLKVLEASKEVYPRCGQPVPNRK